MLNTHTDGGQIATRPMSNNRDVEYDGDSWFFVAEEVAHLRRRQPQSRR